MSVHVFVNTTCAVSVVSVAGGVGGGGAAAARNSPVGSPRSEGANTLAYWLLLCVGNARDGASAWLCRRRALLSSGGRGGTESESFAVGASRTSRQKKGAFCTARNPGSIADPS